MTAIVPSLLAFETLEYLQYPFARHALMAAVLVATASSVLSSIVVLKRLAFVGQGVSHAAFGGIGVAALFGLSGLAGEAVILGFCLASALFIARLSRARTREDTAIGVVLVTTMALGFLLLGVRQNLLTQPWYREFIAEAPSPASWDAVLFGSVHTAGPMGVWLSLVVVVVVVAAVWWWRRPLLFYVFDENTAEAAGVSVRWIRVLLMILLALVVVVGMKLVGVVLISALLILPGATAAYLTRSLAVTVLWSWLVAIVGVVGGLVMSFELELPSGPCIVVVLTAELAVAAAAQGLSQR